MNRAPRILWLDALRALSALTVLEHHAFTIFPALLPALQAYDSRAASLAAFISRRNTEAVLVFFLLSGASIRFSVERRGLSAASAVNDYLYRRLRRILPLYWLSLALSGAVALLVAPVSPPALSALTLLGNLLFLQSASGVRGQWVVPFAGNEALWSLSFEMFFYLAYPLLVWRVQRRALRACTVLLASAAGLVIWQLWPNPFAMFLAAGPIWYFGVELAERHLRGSTSLPWPMFVLLWLGLFGLWLGPQRVMLHGLFVGTSLLLVGLGVLAAPLCWDFLQRLLTTSPLRVLPRLGDASYALYLLHVPVLRAFAALLGTGLASASAAVSCSLVLAIFAERAAQRLQWTWLKRAYVPASWTNPQTRAH